MRRLLALLLAPVCAHALLLLRTHQSTPAVYFAACALHPSLAPQLTLDGEDVTTTVAVAVAGTSTDVLAVDPDPQQPCIYGAPPRSPSVPAAACGPCPPLTVTSANGTLHITGQAPTSTHQACLRRVYLTSTADGGQEGDATRTVTFTAVSGSGESTADTALALWGARDDAACVVPTPVLPLPALGGREVVAEAAAAATQPPPDPGPAPRRFALSYYGASNGTDRCSAAAPRTDVLGVPGVCQRYGR